MPLTIGHDDEVGPCSRHHKYQRRAGIARATEDGAHQPRKAAEAGRAHVAPSASSGLRVPRTAAPVGERDVDRAHVINAKPAPRRKDETIGTRPHICCRVASASERSATSRNRGTKSARYRPAPTYSLTAQAYAIRKSPGWIVLRTRSQAMNVTQDTDNARFLRPRSRVVQA